MTTTDAFEQPTMQCPRCHKVYEDFDGWGVVYCAPADDGCGFCEHVARSGDGAGGWICDFCGEHEAPPPTLGAGAAVRALRGGEGLPPPGAVTLDVWDPTGDGDLDEEEGGAA